MDKHERKTRLEYLYEAMGRSQFRNPEQYEAYLERFLRHWDALLDEEEREAA